MNSLLYDCNYGLQTLSLGYFFNYEASGGQLGFGNVPLLFG